MQNISKVYQLTQNTESFRIKNQKWVSILLKVSVTKHSELSNYLWMKIPFDIFKFLIFRRKNLSNFFKEIWEGLLNNKNTSKSLIQINGLFLLLIMSWCIDAEKKILIFFFKSICTFLTE